MASPNSPLGSPDEIALNQAILESLRHTAGDLPPPTWNNQTQFIPVQTTTTYIPVPQTQVRLPTIPQPQVPFPQNNTVHVPTVPQLTNVRVPTVPQPVRSPTVPILPGFNVPTIQTSRTPTVPILPTPNVPFPQPVRSPTVPFPQPVRSPTVPVIATSPTLPVIQPVRNPTIPVVPSPFTVPQTTPIRIPTGIQNTGTPITTLPPIPRTQIPVVPPLATTTTRKTGFNLPVSPRTTFQPLQTVQLSPRNQGSPRSPGRMSPDEEDQLRIAIMASLQEANLPATTIPPIVRTPPRSPLITTPDVNEDEDIEDALLQEAIQASILAAEQARLANFHANQVINAPVSPRGPSPNTVRLLEDRALREQQDREYQEALRIDIEKAEHAKKAAEAAAKAAAAAEEAAMKLKEAKLAEEARKEALQPPVLQFPIEAADPRDIYMIRFKLPSGSTVNHSFHRDEPFSSVIQQIRFDLKHLGELSFVIQPAKAITCDPATSISACGIDNRILIFVTYAD